MRRPSLDLLHEWAGACGRTYVFDFPASSAEGVGVLARAAAAPLPVREIIDEILSVERPSEASLQALQAHVRAWRQQARGVGTA